MLVLQRKSGSGVVTIPKKHLRRDGLLEDDEVPEQHPVDVERIGRRAYVIRFPENGELPELTEAPLIQKIAAQVQFVPRSEIDADPDPDAGRVAAGVTEDDKV